MLSAPSLRPITPLVAVGRFRAVVLAPTFDNAPTLIGLLENLAFLELDILVVDDGSTDGTAGLLRTWSMGRPGRTVLTHGINRGKAAALRTGFTHATGAGFTHAVTIDTDGQLSPADIPRLLDAARERPDAFVLGVRDITAADYPARSRVGRQISNRLVWLETHVQVGDSQCGLRVYPLAAVPFDQCWAGHYGFETEVITRAVWAGVPLVQLPVACRYFPPGDRVSHFRPGLDSLRAVRLHLRLLLAASLPRPDRRRRLAPGQIPARSLPVRFFHWINPIEAWRQVRREQSGRTRFAAGFAIGTFIGTIPTYGIQTILSLFVAKRFRLHPVSVLAGSNVSTPPLGPVLLAASVAIGHLMLRGQLPHWVDYQPSHLKMVVGPLLLDYLVGSLLVGAVFGAVVFVCIDGLLRFLPDGRPDDQSDHRPTGEPA
jgi:uncharacterized protein (DUF2062 family)